MTQHLTFSILLLVLLTAADRCGLNPFSSDETRYRIQTIGDTPLQDHVSKWHDRGGIYPTIPVEIRFDTLPPERPFKGSVQLVNGEWKTIENPSGSKVSFDVSILEKETHPDYIILTFSQLEIHGDSLSGKVGAWGPAVDGIPEHFIAMRK